MNKLKPNIMAGVYTITSKVLSCVLYVGATSDLKRRERHHWQRLSANKNNNHPLQDHFNKYGFGDIEFIVLEKVPDITKLTEKEQYYIDTLNPTCNIARIAGSLLGTKRTDEVKRKLSEIQRGKPGRVLPMEERLKISERMMGNKIGVGNKHARGKKMTEEAKIKISEKLKGRKYTASHVEKFISKKRKKIIQTTPDGSFVREWISISDAGRQLKISAGHICTAIKKGKTFYNFKWDYKNETV